MTFSSDARFAGDNAQPGLTAKAGRPFKVRLYGRDAGASRPLSFKPAAPHGSVRVQWAALRDGWPAGVKPLPPRPANVMATGSSDATIMTGETTLRW